MAVLDQDSIKDIELFHELKVCYPLELLRCGILLTVCNTNLIQIIFKHSVFTLKKTQRIYITKTDWLMTFREIIFAPRSIQNPEIHSVGKTESYNVVLN